MRVTNSKGAHDYWLVLAVVLSLSPFLLQLKHFRELFWFGDELHLLVQIKSQGFWPWTMSTFGENFQPLFKLFWGAGVFLFHGDYFAMVVAVWLTHAFNLLLFGKLLQEAGFSRFAMFFSVISLGATWTNINSLTWTIQWSPVFSITFLLISTILLMRMMRNGEKLQYKLLILFCLSCLAGALSFSKGVIVCFAFFLFVLGHRRWTFKAPYIGVYVALAAIVPAIIVTVMIFLFATGNHHQVVSSEAGSRLPRMGSFAVHYFLLNPLFRIFLLPLPFEDGTIYLWTVGGLKLIVLVTAFFIASRRTGSELRLLIFLTVLDLVSAAIIGVGRYHEGNYNAVPSRYQYSALVSFAPCLAIVVDKMLSLLGRLVESDREPFWRVVPATVAAVWFSLIALPWISEMKQTAPWQGTQSRDLLLKGVVWEDRPPQHGLWIGLPPVISLDEAKDVVREYELH